MVLAIVTMMSCQGVAIKKVQIALPAPQYLMTLEAPFRGIFLEKSIKNKAKLKERKIIPALAQFLEGLREPFKAMGANRLLIKFLVQSKPTIFLSDHDPPGYRLVAISSKIPEQITPMSTEYFLSI